MATTIDDIIAARNAAMHILDHEIQDALAKQNAATSEASADRFNGPIHQLMAQRVAIFEQAADDMLNSSELASALNTLRSLTSDMNAVAARMGSVAGFFKNVADFLDAASKVAGVLKGPGG